MAKCTPEPRNRQGTAATSPSGATSIPDDIAAGIVSFEVDPTAEPADCAEVVAALLISAWQQRQAQHADCPNCASGGCGNADCKCSSQQITTDAVVVDSEVQP